jgi:hypothetical protein
MMCACMQWCSSEQELPVTKTVHVVRNPANSADMYGVEVAGCEVDGFSDPFADFQHTWRPKYNWYQGDLAPNYILAPSYHLTLVSA